MHELDHRSILLNFSLSPVSLQYSFINVSKFDPSLFFLFFFVLFCVRNLQMSGLFISLMFTSITLEIRYQRIQRIPIVLLCFMLIYFFFILRFFFFILRIRFIFNNIRLYTFRISFLFENSNICSLFQARKIHNVNARRKRLIIGILGLSEIW